MNSRGFSLGDVAKKIADALEVSLDYLDGGSYKAAFDKQTLKLIDKIEELEPSVKDKLIFLANAIIRYAKTGKAYFIINNKARRLDRLCLSINLFVIRPSVTYPGGFNS